MSNSIALISGKGGSGKTTLALSMASLLSDFGLRVLLIDCDFSTHGATYFFEEKLQDIPDEGVISTSELLYSPMLRSTMTDDYFLSNSKVEEIKGKPIHINDNWDFIPSVLKIDEDYLSYRQNKNSHNIQSLKNIKVSMMNLIDGYDVIIYDCQAGYSEVLQAVVYLSDTCLAVMEADAISSSAIRTLFLKIGEGLKKKKVYQVFNKVTSEEYDIYSKVSGGMVFTNIETILFDFQIRKDFAVAQIPDMKKTSAKYEETVYNICKILIKDSYCLEIISKFEKVIEKNRIEERRKNLQTKIDRMGSLRRKKTSSSDILMSMAVIFPAVFAILGLLTSESMGVFYDFKDRGGIMIFALLIMVEASFLIWLIERYKNRSIDRKEKQKYIEELEEINREYEEIKMELKS